MLNLPKYLYHGTDALTAQVIFEKGILPRGKIPKSKGNWSSSIESNPRSVYLTECYGLYFAANRQYKNETAKQLAVLEVDTTKLDPSLFCADEDACEQVNRGHDKVKGDMVRRTRWYRARQHLYRAEASLAVLGTCCYRGVIPPEAISRAVTVDCGKQPHLIFSATDASISVMNYRFVGSKYKSMNHWLFEESLPNSSKEMSDIERALGFTPPPEGREGIKVIIF